MTLRAFVFDKESLDRVATVKRVAELAGNWYIVGQSAHPPGDLPRHVFDIGGVKCVFSITLNESLAGWQFYRHASFSLPESAGEKTPNPIAIFTIANLLGFTGGEVEPCVENEACPMILSPAKDWQLGVQDGGVVVIAQLLDPNSMPKPASEIRTDILSGITENTKNDDDDTRQPDGPLQ